MKLDTDTADFDIGPMLIESLLNELGYLRLACYIIICERGQPHLYRAFCWEKHP